MRCSQMFLGFCLVALSAGAVRAGPRSGGGGDLCENRIQIVRDDIKTWISAGGAKSLNLPSGVSADQYAFSMMTQIDTTKVSCVGQGDVSYPVQINGTPKICIFLDGANKQVICDFDKFQKLSQSDQYVLIHHEYAGLAKIENPEDDISTYQTSNQISGFLTNVEVKRLSIVKPTPQPENDVRGNFQEFVGTYKIMSCSTDHQEGVGQQVTHEGCGKYDSVRLYFGEGYFQPKADARDFFIDLFASATPDKLGASFWLATAKNQIGTFCTTYIGAQYCGGESDYTHWIQNVTLKSEDGLLKVDWSVVQPDLSHYNYTSESLILKKIAP